MGKSALSACFICLECIHMCLCVCMQASALWEGACRQGIECMREVHKQYARWWELIAAHCIVWTHEHRAEVVVLVEGRELLDSFLGPGAAENYCGAESDHVVYALLCPCSCAHSSHCTHLSRACACHAIHRCLCCARTTATPI